MVRLEPRSQEQGAHTCPIVRKIYAWLCKIFPFLLRSLLLCFCTVLKCD